MMSDNTASAACYAVVLDVEAEIIRHQNGTKYLRLLMTQDAAQDLYRTLGELLS